jgi:hypothetical protein
MILLKILSNMKTLNIVKSLCCLAALLLATACGEPGFQQPSGIEKPVVLFTDGITSGEYTETAIPVTVSFDVTSAQPLTLIQISIKDDDAAAVVDEKITTFDTPYSHHYEKSFIVPNGVMLRTVSVYAENDNGAAFGQTQAFKITGDFVVKNDVVLEAMDKAYKQWEIDGKIPDKVKILGRDFSRGDWCDYAIQTLQNLVDGNDPKQVLRGLGLGAAPDNDSFKKVGATNWDMMIPWDLMASDEKNDLLYRNVNYIIPKGTNTLFSNYCGFPNSNYPKWTGVYEGNFSFNRFTVCMMRALSYYKENGKFPDTISCQYLIVAAYVPPVVGTFTQSALIDAMAAAYNDEYVGKATVPTTIKVGETTLTQVEFYYAASQVLTALVAGKSDDINVVTYKVPEAPALETLAYDKETIALQNGPVDPANNGNTEDVMNLLSRQQGYANDKERGNGAYANNSGYNREDSKYPQLCWNRVMVILLRIMAEYKEKGALPTEVATGFVPEQKPVDPGEGGPTIKAFLTEAVKVLDTWAASGAEGERVFSNDVKITFDGKEMGKGEILTAIFKITAYLHAGGAVTINDGMPAYTVHNVSTEPTRENVGNGVNPLTSDTGKGDWSLVENTNRRQMTYAETGDGKTANVFANNCGFTNKQLTGYNGICCLDRVGLITLRMYKHILDNNITDGFPDSVKDVLVDIALN